jgi:hypothetical protein
MKASGAINTATMSKRNDRASLFETAEFDIVSGFMEIV